jgi:replicative superfamily II helicase
LASFQAKELKDKIIEDTLKGLMNCGAIYETEDGLIRATSLGKIASMFYYSPWDVSDLSRNFTKMFKAKKENDDAWVSFALGNIDSFRYGIVSAGEKEELGSFDARLNKAGAKADSYNLPGSVKAAYAYFCLLNGIPSAAFSGFMNGLRIDMGRLKEVLSAINYMSAKWNAKEYLQKLNMRLHYGVTADDEKLLSIIKLEGVGKVKAKKLHDRGLTTYADIAKSVDKIILALNCTKKTAEKIAANAAELANAK